MATATLAHGFEPAQVSAHLGLPALFITRVSDYLFTVDCDQSALDAAVAAVVAGTTSPAMIAAEQARVGQLIAHGRAVLTALEAAEILSAEHGIECDVLDLRSIRPLDEDAILETVAKTNRVVLVDENKPFCAVSSQIAALIQEKAFDDLDAPVQRVCSLDAPAIYSPPVEKEQLPTAARVIEKVLAIA